MYADLLLARFLRHFKIQWNYYKNINLNIFLIYSIIIILYFSITSSTNIVHTKYVKNEIPPHVEYSLTEKGKALYPIYIEMFNWGEKYKSNKQSFE